VLFSKDAKLVWCDIIDRNDDAIAFAQEHFGHYNILQATTTKARFFFTKA